MNSSNTSRKGRIMAADDPAIGIAVQNLCAGHIVAVPTETVYGLAADASNASAVAAIYRAKGRPDFNPLIVHVGNRAAAMALAYFDNMATRLADAFWPGPLTLVLPLRPESGVAAAVTAGLPTIALRSPAHPVMQALLAQCGLSLAAPSANRSGSISPTTAQHVLDSLGDAAPMILDGGPCAAGIESTIVAVRKNGWQILRPGPISAAQIEQVTALPSMVSDDRGIEAPGQLASHYAPSKPIRLNVLEPDDDAYYIGFGPVSGDDNLSAQGDLAEAAAHLFAALHRADASDAATIAVVPIPDVDIGVAINDRLRRAAA
jgi:L-threonylcarbamoyladenylate synthase